MTTNNTKSQKTSVSQSILKDNWALLAVLCLVLSFLGTLISYFVDPEIFINLSLNISTEALGMVATVVFIQRYLDKANQYEAEQTKKMIKRNFSDMKKLIFGKDNIIIQRRYKKQRYSMADYSPKKQNRIINRKRRSSP